MMKSLSLLLVALVALVATATAFRTTTPLVMVPRPQTLSATSTSSTWKVMAPNTHHHHSAIINRVVLHAQTSNTSDNSDSETDSVTSQQQQQQQSFWRPAATAALLGVTAVATAATTQSATAMDLASNLAFTKTAWWSSIAETGFYQAFSLVFVSEIGDKTFFIAGILGAKTGRFLSFVGSVAALAAMTVVSVLIGQIFHAVPSGIADGIPLDDVAAVLAFAFFGFKTLKEALDMDESSETSVMDEELAEAEEAVEETTSSITAAASKLGVLASIFTLVFAAEFGDRSFLSTIALSAAQNPVSVAGGAIAAHAVATGIAVAGGSYIAKYISERVIGIVGGALFLVFAVTTALGIF